MTKMIYYFNICSLLNRLFLWNFQCNLCFSIRSKTFAKTVAETFAKPCLWNPDFFRQIDDFLKKMTSICENSVNLTIFSSKLLQFSSFPSPVWKNENLSRNKKIFHQINSLLTYLVKSLLSRTFCNKCVRDNPLNFRTLWSQCSAVWRKFTLSHAFLTKISWKQRF